MTWDNPFALFLYTYAVGFTVNAMLYFLGFYTGFAVRVSERAVGR